jgi:hypothetical protein
MKTGVPCCPGPKCVLPCASSCYEVIILQPISTKIDTTTTTFGGGTLNLNFGPATNNWQGGGVYQTFLPTGGNQANVTIGKINFLNTRALGCPPSFTSPISVTGTDGNLTVNSQFSGDGLLTSIFSGCDANISGSINVSGNGYSSMINITGNGSFTQSAGFPTLTISNINLGGQFVET